MLKKKKIEKIFVIISIILIVLDILAILYQAYFFLTLVYKRRKRRNFKYEKGINGLQTDLYWG